MSHHTNTVVTAETELKVGDQISFFTRKSCTYSGVIKDIVNTGTGRGNGLRYVIDAGDDGEFRLRRGQITHVHH